ncbi:MAG: UDP-N-acetylmuramoyl-L-alanyl-D-glutamate--2,6-diaminopimelate ligase [Bacteroidetes bacterium]|nr:UDP-N-acetylmuramoyl-L-alanyl-D-glutamate--2,6-diaminopimelate ligase [Bacteroidota bacterium]MBU1580616.1 UDP-N-acetylmuramoyl-L-alanyl-D-glutamate--2,6-diaminopimelate ligase [Bacteroidota bacterium]MBU2466453.1 UDP-N-acetylmuramoyl-L-alanyl-D-glutamate--2,6-diaminopimelate ligase [Bacteroidota bacterium]MBU2557658.1 UDP-N-acetylmuramoyl-L-alanyl-D-glutamate--2,6-diaminopimelate ligase [Bacteroidota bacterium]
MTKLLSDILYKCPVRQVIGNTELAVEAIHFDSRKLHQDSVFFAVKGSLYDGHLFINKAIDAGAIAVVCEKIPEEQHEHITYVRVENTAYSLALAAANYYDHPSKGLKLVGVTGTNGKTTIATLLHSLFTENGFPCGLLSTIENKIGNKKIKATHTTPDPLAINALLAEMVKNGCSHAFMEVSSHAIDQFRVLGLHFAGGIFTNLTHDHLDYHGTFQAYRDVKKNFFDWLDADAFALINLDDKNGRFMVQNTRASVFTYSLRSEADYRAKVLENSFEGLLLLLNGNEISTRLAGYFNASNLLAIYGTAHQLGLPEIDLLKGISLLKSATGRFEIVYHSSGITGIIDYAHTPDALLNVLKTIDDVRTHNEQLITVAGAGGDRDVTKRPEMARIGASFSDRLLLTSDNPRSEAPGKIIEDMRKGVEPQNYNRVLAISDRKEAIRTAVALSAKGDIILVAGKGHEKYQEINGVKYPFDDMEVLKDALNQRLV